RGLVQMADLIFNKNVNIVLILKILFFSFPFILTFVIPMAVLIAVRPVRRRVGPVLLGAVAVFGLATIVLGLTRSYTVAFAALVVASAADMVSVFIRVSLVPLVTPDEKRGRVLAVENVFIGASNELGAFESGVVGQAIGTPATVVGGGVGTLVVVAVWAAAFPAIRRIDRFEDQIRGG
ncbi:MAG: hypothetical protein AAB131_10785, partial [Actinomycetota bacterium]